MKLVERLFALNPYRRARQLLWRASMAGLPRGERITRYSMYRRLAEVGPRLPFRTGSVLSISHSEKLAEVLGITPATLTQADYPDHTFLDLRFPDASFDFVVADMVLEHVEGNPQQAVDEARRVLRDGGISILTSVFDFPVHNYPGDFWRFTPDGLALLHRGFSEIIAVGGWGNPRVWEVLKDGMFIHGVPHASWHPYHRIATHNDPSRPICVWIVARK